MSVAPVRSAIARASCTRSCMAFGDSPRCRRAAASRSSCPVSASSNRGATAVEGVIDVPVSPLAIASMRVTSREIVEARGSHERMLGVPERTRNQSFWPRPDVPVQGARDGKQRDITL
jgi:hypothetical protein